MKIKNLLTSTFLCLTFLLQAQSPYELIVESGTYANLTENTSLNNGITWDDPQITIPIGFDFDFLGQTIDEVYLEDLGLGGFLTSDTSEMGTFPIFIAYGADIIDRGFDFDKGIGSGSLSNISYQLEGSAGSRILKIEWRNAGFFGDVSNDGIAQDSINFQVWFHEGSNEISIHFGPKSITNTYAAFEGETGAPIGFFPQYNASLDEIIGTAYLLGGSPLKPFLEEFTDDDDDVVYLDGIIPDGTIYRFSPIMTNTIDLTLPATAITLAPNPAVETVNLLYDRNKLNITNARILSTNGQVLRQLGNVDHPIAVADLPVGVYTLQLQTKSGQLISKKLLKQ